MSDGLRWFDVHEALNRVIYGSVGIKSSPRRFKLVLYSLSFVGYMVRYIPDGQQDFFKVFEGRVKGRATRDGTSNLHGIPLYDRLGSALQVKLE